MNIGQKSLNVETKSLSEKIIKEKCNKKQCDHETIICNFSNFIVDRFDSHSGKEHVQSVLLSKGYKVCKKKEADYYAIVTKKGSDCSELNFWMRSVQ